MSLHIHRAERADRLVEALGELLSTPLPDPFATEIVSVPTPGVERWLAQRLSRRLGASPGRTDGICAGVDFRSPRRLVARAVGEALGREPELDPWQPERAVWPLLRVIDELPGRGLGVACCGAISATGGPTTAPIRYAVGGAGRPPGTWPTCSPRTPRAGPP